MAIRFFAGSTVYGGDEIWAYFASRSVTQGVKALEMVFIALQQESGFEGYTIQNLWHTLVFGMDELVFFFLLQKFLSTFEIFISCVDNI